MVRFTEWKSPVGTLLLTCEDEALTSITFLGRPHVPPIGDDWREDANAAPLRACMKQLGEYFARKRRAFDLTMQACGTTFQQRIWREIARIPFGETVSYATLAKRAGSPDSARAAGAATGRNPLSIVVPCHRVVGTSGKLTGYAGGVEKKVKLLALEGVDCG